MNKKNLFQNIIAIIGLIFLALFIFFISNKFGKNFIGGIKLRSEDASGMHNNKELCIELDGVKITQINGEKIDLNINGKYDLKSGENHNILEIKNGKIACIEANCKDKICVKKGFIDGSTDNSMIICAPHKLIIYFK